ncbi:MAG TPA: hypothetical protein VMW27_18715 [Thermoanaerobaculia bacterium]|nr:hypothetical protein [Thermoanaerobaculia bacterium]
MAPLAYRYREAVLQELERFGIRPGPATPPARVRAFLNDLYTFELREIKVSRREAERFFGPQPRELYVVRVQAVKEKYPLLSLPVEVWTEPG